MVGFSVRGKVAGVVAAFLLMAVGVKAQTAVWDGDTDDNFELAGNYQGGMVPNAGTTLDLPAVGGTIIFNASDSVLGIVFQDPGEGQWNLNPNGGGTLTIGAGGMGPQDGETEIIAFVSVPIILATDQTWNGSSNGFILTSGVVSGNASLTIQGRIYMTGTDTFTGGVTIQNAGTLNVGNDAAAGTGSIDVQNGGAIETYSDPHTLANPTTLEDGASLGSDAPANVLTFSGPVTFVDSIAQLNLFSASSVAFTGAVVGPGMGILTVSGQGSQLPADGGSQLVMTGALSGMEALNINNAQVIIAPTGDAALALGSLDTSALAVNTAYLGLGGTFAAAGELSTFLSVYGSNLGSGINGSIGLDNIGNSGVFSDPIDLSSFTNPNFLGLGSATAATVTGAITPSNLQNYVFGGGGGVLTIMSDLDEFNDGTTLTMSAAPSPVTVILEGNLGFTGGVTSNGGVLIFNTPTNQSGSSMTLNGGYVGYTSAATDITAPADFIALLEGTPSGVIGFDTTDLAAPANITQAIDLSMFSAGSDVYLGTSSAATLSGVITPSANNQYQFTGVKGGALTVSSTLTGSNSLTVGLPNPIESNASVSSVTLTGDNDFSGGTTLNSGILNVTSDTALGTGSVFVPDTGGYTVGPILAAPLGAVTLANDISFGNLNDGNTPGLTLGRVEDFNLTLSGTLSNFDGIPGYLAIAGTATLSGNNTYTGGTAFTGTGSPNLTLGSSSALGTGTLTINTQGSLIAGATSVAVPNAIVLNQPLTIGVNGNTNTMTLNGDISGGNDLTILSPVDIPNGNPSLTGEVFVYNTMVTIENEESLGTGQLFTSDSTIVLGIPDPTIVDLSGNSASLLSLESGATLTLYTPNPLEEFDGAISGDVSNSVVKIGAGTEYLNGTSTFGSGLDISQGTVIAGKSGSVGTGAISVGSGAALATNSGAVLTNALSLADGSSVQGTGAFATPGGVTLMNGTSATPGNAILGAPVGALTFTTGLTFGTGGVYNFNLSDAGGSAGTGYSTINVSGGLTISATAGSPFVINVSTFDPMSNQPGLANFNPFAPYSWMLLSADTISGFATNKFMVDTGNFQNSFPGGSTFTLVQAGPNLILDFTPVPEPSTWVLLGGGLLLVGLAVRRRRRAA